jgi:hypothetical protein
MRGRIFLLLACAQLLGCELVADFDRGKVASDASVDANVAPKDAGTNNDDDAATDD